MVLEHVGNQAPDWFRLQFRRQAVSAALEAQRRQRCLQFAFQNDPLGDGDPATELVGEKDRVHDLPRMLFATDNMQGLGEFIEDIHDYGSASIERSASASSFGNVFISGRIV